MVAQKQNFTMSSATVPKANADERVATALEFIAHYLDRIDDHLEALAAQARAGTAESAKMAMALQSVTQLLGRIASNP